MSDEAIFHAETNSVQRLLSRRCKNVEDCRVSVSRLLAMTPITLTLAMVLAMGISESRAHCTCSWGGADSKTLTISNCHDGQLSLSSCANQGTANNVIVGTGVTSIGMSAFGNATGLTSITIPEGVTSIGLGAFSRASSLTSITLPDSLTSIEFGAFAFTGLTSITLPGSVTSIGNMAFYIPGLTDINCKGTEAECDALETLLTETDSVPAGINFNRVAPTQPTAASCANSGKVLQGTECVSSCGSSFRLNDGECDRIRYTPAEAAAVLKDTDNEIIMTFKVNR